MATTASLGMLSSSKGHVLVGLFTSFVCSLGCTRAEAVVLQQEIFFQSNNCTSTHLDAIRLKQPILEHLGWF
jgi:hypothetical protein